MNLGIVIGVSSYQPGVGDLKACVTDATAIAALLKADAKFNEVLVVSDNTTSSSVKRQITEFISRHKGNHIDEVFFYFTGHGDFLDGEFYYLLSDFDPKRRKQTAIENAEVDSWLKALSPTTAVKFIDACHSGMAYIKDATAFKTYLNGTTPTFKNCYFLFSSQADQFSYQDAGLSFFTRAVVESVLVHDDTELRYKDVIDFVSDRFSSNSSQTPFFVVQADFTETFCTVSATLKAAVLSVLPGETPATAKPTPTSTTLADLVRADAARYCSESESRAALDKLMEKLNSVPHPSDLSGLFSITIEKGSEFSNLPDATAIGNWLSQNQHTFFAVPYSRVATIKRRKLKNPRHEHLAPFLVEDDDAWHIVEEEESRVCGFKPMVEMPYLYLLLRATPLFPNISANDCYVVPIVSKTEIRLFYTFCRYRDTGWDRSERSREFNWVTEAFPTKDHSSISEAVTTIAAKLWLFVREQLEQRFGPPKLSDQDNGEDSRSDRKVVAE
jgi:uncharacterized caspase-like protein